MKKSNYVLLLTGIAFCLVSCGSTAPCGLAKTKELKQQQNEEVILVSDARIK